MRTRKIAVVCALCLMLACLLCACDMQGLVSELQSERNENNAEGLGGFVGMVAGTDENGNYIVRDENGSIVTGDFTIIQGNGNGVIINGTVSDPLSQVDAYKAEDFTLTARVTDYVKITVSDYGEIVVRLYPESAPETVENFKKLVGDGFYDGLVFHRVIQNFMIQGGGFDESGAQRETGTIKGEFASNGYQNAFNHVRGVVSMARANNPNSASSQFFICDTDNPHLDGDYAAFGVVVAGMDVVDKIAAVKTDGSDCPEEQVVIESAVFVMPLVAYK